jgi:transcriptional regulator with XRE-family HTH domain
VRLPAENGVLEINPVAPVPAGVYYLGETCAQKSVGRSAQVSDTVGSALLRRYIGRRFRALRLRADLTQEEAAAALDRGRATLSRIEDGDDRIRFREVDVRAMLTLFKATDDETELLLALTAETRNGRRKSWWHDFTETALPAWFGLYVTLEDSAEKISQYVAELVPGLLQTRAYAEQVIKVPSGYVGDEEVERRVRVRMERQSLLTRPRAPHLSVVLNEAVLHRPVGGTEVMAEQLEHLVEITKRANVSVRILPFAAGVHGGMAACGPFTLLDFPVDPQGEPLEPPLAYAETLTGAMYLNKPEEANAYRLAWKDIEERALDKKESRAFIEKVQEGYTSGG